MPLSLDKKAGRTVCSERIQRVWVGRWIKDVSAEGVIGEDPSSRA